MRAPPYFQLRSQSLSSLVRYTFISSPFALSASFPPSSISSSIQSSSDHDLLCIRTRPSTSTSLMSDVAILSQGVGYGVVLGIGFFFAALMCALTWVQNRYTTRRTSSVAEFASASHSVKPGMIACAIVSSWTWAAT